MESFPPGHLWTPEDGLERFADAVPVDGREAAEAQQEPTADARRRARETRETLITSVRRQMMGDVPVGVFLSGGLDSSLIAAIAAQAHGRSTASGCRPSPSAPRAAPT